MKAEERPTHIKVGGIHYALDVTPQSVVLTDPRTGHKLFETRSPLLMRPVFVSGPSEWRTEAVSAESADAGATTVRATGASPEGDTLQVTLRCWPEHIELAAEAKLAHDRCIAHWELLDSDMHLNMFHAHHWRNQHGHTATFETHNLYQGGKTAEQTASPSLPQEMREQFTRVCDLTTYSYDWQFNPHPSFMLFQRDSVTLGIGARDLPYGFGIEQRSAALKLQHLRYNYGGEHGLDVAGGTTAHAPRTYLWLDHHGQSVWDSVDHYVRLLQEDGEVPQRSLRDVPHWWLRPAYCTWGDQGYLSGNPAFYNVPGDTFAGKGAVKSFDTVMLDHLLNQLEKLKLPFGTVIIDDGWQKTRGDWTPHPERFPALRARIDRIHALGMKAMLWIAPFDFHADADIRQKTEWLCGDGTLGRHGMPMVDFSSPQVQQEYVEPLARFLFSSDPDCLDADGLKLDFMADKVHPVFPVHDPEWRGEERFALGWQSLMYRLLKTHKPAGQMLGGTVHPHFIGCQDLVRTYDVPVSQFQHADRAVMIRHFCPGNLVALDMGETKSLADVEEHLQIAYQHSLLYECGRVAPDPATGEFPAGPDYIPLLRRKLRAWV